MTYLLWLDLKTTPASRVQGACAAFEARYGAPPTLVLVAAGEGAEIAGVEVRESRAGELVVQRGTVAVTRAEQQL